MLYLEFPFLDKAPFVLWGRASPVFRGGPGPSCFQLCRVPWINVCVSKLFPAREAVNLLRVGSDLVLLLSSVPGTD